MDHWADYVIFAIFLLASIGIGLYHAFTGGKQKTTEEFISANRKLKVLPTAVSLVVSYLSALTIIGAPSELYAHGIIYWPGYALISPIVGCTIVSLFIIPWLYPLKLTSVFSYFNLRYDNGVIQKFTSVLSIINAVMYTGIATLAPAIAMETTTGFPSAYSIPIITAVGVIYTALGGMRAVIWTDVFQSVVMIGGIIVIMVKAFIHVGGIGESFALLHENNRILFDISPDPTARHTIWGFLFGYSIAKVSLTGLAQASVQRYCSVSSLTEAKWIPFVWLIGTATVVSLCMMAGVPMFAYYAKYHCDPILSGKVQSSNQMFPLFVMELFRGIHGFSGLFLATLYSATLSSVSSALSGSAANAWDDFVKPIWPTMSQSRATLVNKISIVFFGAMSAGFAFLFANVEGPILQISISFLSALSGPITGLFFLAGFQCFQWVNWQGALTGGIMGLGITIWIIVGSVFVKGCHPYSPPLPVDGCQNLLNTTINFDDIIPSNVTVRTVAGFNRIYCTSYLWNFPIGIVSVIITALIATIILKTILREKYHNPTPDDVVFIKLFRKQREIPVETEQKQALMAATKV